jgi:uncharacterized membrane protein
VPAEVRHGPGHWHLGALVPALVGLAAATYLTVEHYRSPTTFACPDHGAINCAKVTTSSYSHVAGVPVAVAGLAYFVVMIALVSPWAWRVRRLDVLRVAGAVVGIISVVYLVWAELFRIDALCLWCTAVHICTLAMLAGIAWYTVGYRPAHPSPRS